MDDKSKSGKFDDLRINVNEPYELAYWSNKFSVSKEQLKNAVNTAGPRAAKVQEYLKTKNTR